MARKETRPSETQEQIALARTLKGSGLFFTAVPNGGYRLRSEARTMKMMGVRPGIPDILVFDVPVGSRAKGLALELKRAGGVPSDVSKAQRKCLEELEARGWLTIVAFGAADAREKMTKLGYELRGY